MDTVFRHQRQQASDVLRQDPSLLDAVSSQVFSAFWFCAEQAGVARWRVGPARHRCRRWVRTLSGTLDSSKEGLAGLAIHGGRFGPEVYRRARHAFSHEVAVTRREGWADFLTAFAAGRRAAFCFRIVRRNMAGTLRSPPPRMRLGDQHLDPEESALAWPRVLSSAPAVGDIADPEWAWAAFRTIAHAEQLTPLAPFSPFTSAELGAARATLDVNTSAGPDGISYAPLRAQHLEWDTFWLSLFNASLATGQVPEFWKEGHVVPIPKGGSPASFDNWRPITLLACGAKLLELSL